MRVLSAMLTFVAMAAIVIAVAALAFWLGAAAVGGIVFALAWASIIVFAARLDASASRHSRVFWSVLGLLLGPFVAAWLAWRIAPRTMLLWCIRELSVSLSPVAASDRRQRLGRRRLTRFRMSPEG